MEFKLYKNNSKYILREILKKYLPKDYCYFHLKKQRLDALEWGISEIKLLLDELLKYSPNVVITKDIELDENSKILKENFNSFDFKSNNYLNKLSPQFGMNVLVAQLIEIY